MVAALKNFPIVRVDPVDRDRTRYFWSSVWDDEIRIVRNPALSVAAAYNADGRAFRIVLPQLPSALAAVGSRLEAEGSCTTRDAVLQVYDEEAAAIVWQGHSRDEAVRHAPGAGSLLLNEAGEAVGVEVVRTERR